MRFKAVTVGVILASTALGSAALTLGRARGAAWIGQSLELVIPVQVDAGQVDSALCPEADVFHGDIRQDGNRIQVLVESTGQPDSFNFRVLSSALVDEPVVTVYLRAGCTQKSSRKFVLLADLPGETLPVQSRQTPPPAPVVLPAEAKTAIAAAPKHAAQEPPKTDAKEAALKDPAHVQSTSEKKTAKTEAPAPRHKPVDVGMPRLHLDPVDTLSERIKSLEANATNTAQDEAVQDKQKLQHLQDDLRTLLDQAAKNEAILVTLRQRLEQAESDRVPLGMVYGLIALLLLCFGSLAYVVTRRPKLVSTQSLPGPDDSAIAQAAPLANSDETASNNAAAAVQVVHGNIPNLVPNLDEKFSDESKNLAPAGAPAGLPRHHNFNADTLVDLRQQAEFLGKLGKVDEALEILEAGIRSNPIESPLLFLDLLVIANSSNRKADFSQFSAEFTQLFNVKVPEFALFRDEGRSLDAYPALLEHLNGQWESPHVLDVIESCILRDLDALESDPFDLAAFRELISMHGTASEQHRALP